MRQGIRHREEKACKFISYIKGKMLAVHWTPVNNTKPVLKNGIRKSKKGLFCFPLTGHKYLDKWWVIFFNQCGARHRKKYNGIVFRIKKDDLPAYFGHWIGATNRHDFNKEITDLKTLGKQYREMLLWRMGEEIARTNNLDTGVYDYGTLSKLYSELAHKEIFNNPKALTEKQNSVDFMAYTLDDYQIVLSQSISADRIIKVLPQGNEFGRVLRQEKKYGS
jgi:hypothetical protein